MRKSQRLPGYYGLPVIHKSHWKWLIVVYFFLGGIAGAAQAIAGVAAMRDRDRNRPIVRAARYVSLIAFLPCPPLLIFDLGSPERFLHMLRILKLRSPMSIGSWTLMLFGAATTAAAGGQLLEDRPTAISAAPRAVAARLAGLAAVAGAVLGVLLSAYTGALLAATAVPLWAKRALLLGPLFVASAMATGSAAIELALSLPRRHHASAAARIGLLEGICSASELAVLAAWTASLGRIGKPLAAGPIAPVFRHCVVGGGLALPLALRALRPFLPRSIHRPIEIATALLTLAGGLGLRYVLVTAGAASADDPDATFALTARPQRSDAA